MAIYSKFLNYGLKEESSRVVEQKEVEKWLIILLFVNEFIWIENDVLVFFQLEYLK